jgi:hypothetical protein
MKQGCERGGEWKVDGFKTRACDGMKGFSDTIYLQKRKYFMMNGPIY